MMLNLAADMIMTIHVICQHYYTSSLPKLSFSQKPLNFKRHVLKRRDPDDNFYFNFLSTQQTSVFCFVFLPFPWLSLEPEDREKLVDGMGWDELILTAHFNE